MCVCVREGVWGIGGKSEGTVRDAVLSHGLKFLSHVCARVFLVVTWEDMILERGVSGDAPCG